MTDRLGDILKEMRDPNLPEARQAEIVRLFNEMGDREEKYRSWLGISSSEARFKTILADRLFVRKESIWGLAARYAFSNLSLISGDYVDATPWVANYEDEGFSALNTQVTINQKGRYQVIFQVSIVNASPAAGACDAGTKINTVPSPPQDGKNSTLGQFYTYMNAIEEVEYESGDLITLTIRQTQGATLSGAGWISFRKIR
jgi:hypothetical protein